MCLARPRPRVPCAVRPLPSAPRSELISPEEYDQFKPWVKRGYEFHRNTVDGVAGTATSTLFCHCPPARFIKLCMSYTPPPHAPRAVIFPGGCSWYRLMLAIRCCDELTSSGKVALVPGKMEYTPAPANMGFGPGFHEQGAGVISQPR